MIGRFVCQPFCWEWAEIDTVREELPRELSSELHFDETFYAEAALEADRTNRTG